MFLDCLPSIAAKISLSSPATYADKKSLALSSISLVYLKKINKKPSNKGFLKDTTSNDPLFQPIVDKEQRQYRHSDPEYRSERRGEN